MATPLSEQLLAPEPGDSATPRAEGSPLRRYIIASGVLVSLLGFIMVGVLAGSGTTTRATMRLVALEGAPLSLAAGLTSDCYTYTGSTCAHLPCGESLRAECEESKCMCVITGCAGIDHACHEGVYRSVSTGTTLTNVKFGDVMYMPAVDVFDQLKVTALPSVLSFGADQWVVRELPGTTGIKAYLLSTQRFPTYVASIRHTSGTAFSLFGGYESPLSTEESLSKYAVRICSRGDGSIMIGSYEEPVVWFYTHHASWYVYGWALSADPGSGGYWTPSPAFDDFELDACR